MAVGTMHELLTKKYPALQLVHRVAEVQVLQLLLQSWQLALASRK
jgi:hypothetical protein